MTQFSLRDPWKAPVKKTRRRCRNDTITRKLPLQWWMFRISCPNQISFWMVMTESYASPGDGLYTNMSKIPVTARSMTRTSDMPPRPHVRVNAIDRSGTLGGWRCKIRFLNGGCWSSWVFGISGFMAFKSGPQKSWKTSGVVVLSMRPIKVLREPHWFWSGPLPISKESGSNPVKTSLRLQPFFHAGFYHHTHHI